MSALQLHWWLHGIFRPWFFTAGMALCVFTMTMIAGRAVAAESVTLASLSQLLKLLPAGERDKAIANQDNFKKLVQQEMDRKSLLSAAKDNKVPQNKDMQYLVRRSGDQLMIEAYITGLIAEQTPNDFPTDKQIQDFYENNKGKFRIGDRVHLWDIELHAGSGKKLESAMKKAEAIVADLKKGRISFSEAVMKHSKHVPSRLQAGYAGLLVIDVLSPEIKVAVLALSKNQITQPILTQGVLHIVKRGGIVLGMDLPLKDIKEQVKQEIIIQRNQEFRRAVLVEVRKKYPVVVDEKKTTRWWLALQKSTKN